MQSQFIRQLGAAALLLFAEACSVNSFATEAVNKPDLLIAAQIRNEAEIEATSIVLDGLRSSVKRFQTLSLDRLEGDFVGIHYSGSASRNAIDEFMAESISETTSSYVSLGASLKRLGDYGKGLQSGEKLVAILITEGTSDPVVINELQTIAADIPPSVTVYVAGVSPQNRLAFSSIFQPIRERSMLVGQGYSSYQAMIERLQSVVR